MHLLNDYTYETMTIILSERIKTLLKRFLEVEMPTIVENAKGYAGEEPEEDEWTTYFCSKDWLLKIHVLTPTHEHDCSHDGEDLAYGETCDECDPETHTLQFIITYKKTCIAHRNYGLEVPLKTLDAWITSLEKDWKLCRCGQPLRPFPSPNENLCSACYIHSYVRTEEQGGDCCVCHENDLRWVRFQCAHEIHLHCYNHMTDDGRKNMKCPLCRESIAPESKHVRDPYDV